MLYQFIIYSSVTFTCRVSWSCAGRCAWFCAETRRRQCLVRSAYTSALGRHPRTADCPHSHINGQSPNKQVLEAKVASRPKFWPRSRSRPQSFGLGLGLGLKHLASAWLRSAAEEPAAKKKSTDFCTLVCQLQDITLWQNIVTVRERMRNKLCRFDHNDINSPVCCQPTFDTFYS